MIPKCEIIWYFGGKNVHLNQNVIYVALRLELLFLPVQ
jgi:hypothetical protein